MSLEKITKKLFSTENERICELKISSYAYNKVIAYSATVSECCGRDVEIIGYLFHETEDPGVIREIYLPSQHVSETSCKPEENDLDIEAMQGMKARGLLPIGWWHSHGKMQAFHSKTDQDSFWMLSYKYLNNYTLEGLTGRKPFIKDDSTPYLIISEGNAKIMVFEKEKGKLSYEIELGRFDLGKFGLPIRNAVFELNNKEFQISEIKDKKASVIYSLVVNSRKSKPYAEASMMLEGEEPTFFKDLKVVIVDDERRVEQQEISLDVLEKVTYRNELLKDYHQSDYRRLLAISKKRSQEKKESANIETKESQLKGKIESLLSKGKKEQVQNERTDDLIRDHSENIKNHPESITNDPAKDNPQESLEEFYKNLCESLESRIEDPVAAQAVFSEGCQRYLSIRKEENGTKELDESYKMIEGKFSDYKSSMLKNLESKMSVLEKNEDLNDPSLIDIIKKYCSNNRDFRKSHQNKKIGTEKIRELLELWRGTRCPGDMTGKD